jgi:hypothetical protein
MFLQAGAPPFGNSQSYYCDATDNSTCFRGETVAPNGFSATDLNFQVILPFLECKLSVPLPFRDLLPVLDCRV